MPLKPFVGQTSHKNNPAAAAAAAHEVEYIFEYIFWSINWITNHLVMKLGQPIDIVKGIFLGDSLDDLQDWTLNQSLF